MCKGNEEIHYGEKNNSKKAEEKIKEDSQKESGGGIDGHFHCGGRYSCAGKSG